jgi:cyclase
MDCDGTQSGYDNELNKAISQAVKVPVIASGGAGHLDDLAAAVLEGKANAVLAASIFHFGTYTVQEAKTHLAQKGLPVRLLPGLK